MLNANDCNKKLSQNIMKNYRKDVAAQLEKVENALNFAFEEALNANATRVYVELYIGDKMFPEVKELLTQNGWRFHFQGRLVVFS